ncbi:MAG: DHH family phosphoesterase [Lachnospiraceae bacterium]|nr:DHH family phosphoesterase [Lachnospiraceae bacterium]
MSKDIKLKGSVYNYVRWPLYLLIVLVIADIFILNENKQAGLIIAVFLLIYLLISLFVIYKGRERLLEEMVNFATQYGTVQKELLEHLDLAYALIDKTGKILWVNDSFEELTDKNKDYRKSITSVFPAITKEKIEKSADESIYDFQWDGKMLHAVAKKMYIDIEDSKEIEKKGDDVTENDTEFLISLFVYDQTELYTYIRENQEQKLVSALVYIDNYDEVMDRVQDVRKSLLIALVDRKVNQYFSKADALVRKTDIDKYFVVVKEKYLKQLEDDMFSILEEVKTIKAGNDMSVTLSMGFGVSGDTYNENYQYARTAIDLALGRGGDQVVVKENEQVSYYGGKSQKVEKNTRVKARVKAHALREMMESKDNVLVMGHHLSDVDSFGAAVGVYVAARELGKKCQIVINDVTSSLKPFKDMFTPEQGYPEDMFVKSSQAIEAAYRNTLIMVVDTNRPSYTECPELLDRNLAIVVFDHHRQGSEVIKNPVLSYIEPYASSACEMVAEVLQYFADSAIKLKPQEADSIYAGILIDTNSFSTKAGVRTFEAAAYLRRCGADLVRVRKLLRNDFESYQAKAEVLQNATIYREAFAISVCTANVESPTIVAAQAANELLNITGIRASFVLTEYQGKVFISSRSIDENVQVIMERLGGGGHLNIAGAQRNEPVNEVKKIIQNTLDQMIEEGAIEI